MLHAAKLKQEADELEDYSRASMGDPTISDGYAVMAKASSQMLSLLALGNTALFLDIYPLHLFYKRYGIQRFEACRFDRQKIADKVLWPVDPKILPFGYPFLEILQGFRQIERGEVMLGVQSLARHEQLNILQKVLYNRPDMRLLLKSNQAAWVTGIPTGVAAEIQLTLAAQCSRVADRAEAFPRILSADLADPNQRMAFVIRGAQRFDVLLNGPARRDIDQSLRIIGTGSSL